MLEYEWRELERLCERLADLRHRESFALRSKNVGLVEGLKEDIVRTRRQREQLVQHISNRLGTVSADAAASPELLLARRDANPASRSPGGTAEDSGVDSDGSTEIIGFSR